MNSAGVIFAWRRMPRNVPTANSRCSGTTQPTSPSGVGLLSDMAPALPHPHEAGTRRVEALHEATLKRAVFTFGFPSTPLLKQGAKKSRLKTGCTL